MMKEIGIKDKGNLVCFYTDSDTSTMIWLIAHIDRWIGIQIKYGKHLKA